MTPTELQARIRSALIMQTEPCPSRRAVRGEDIVRWLGFFDYPEYECGPHGRVTANLKVLERRGLAERLPGPGTGRWQITERGLAPQ